MNPSAKGIRGIRAIRGQILKPEKEKNICDALVNDTAM